MLFSSEWIEDAAFVLFMIPPFLMALGTAGISTRWKHGKLGGFGLWLALLGAITFSEAGVVGEWFLSDLGWVMFMVGILAHMTGLLLFGLANNARRIFTRWNAFPLVIGLLGGLIPVGLGFILSYDSDLPLILLLGGMGIGWLVMGGLLVAIKEEQA